jgi:hypothetical protein
MERKGQLTLHALSKDRTLADNRAEPPQERHEGPATFMSRMVRSELEELNQDRTIFQWSKRPWVLATMLACCVAVLAWVFFFPSKPNAETQFELGKQKMESSKPEEWGAIWNEYLEPLSRDPDNPHQEDLQEFKQRIDDRFALRRALAGTKDTGLVTEGRRFYLRGLRLCREGDFDAARKVWQSVVDSFQGLESETHWVHLSRDGLAELDQIAPAVPRQDKALHAALERVRALRGKDKKEEAARILKGLTHLYQSDPSSAALIKQIESESNY